MEEQRIDVNEKKPRQSVKSNRVSTATSEIVEFFVEQFVARKQQDDLSGLHKLVVGSIEQCLIQSVIKKCGGNKVRAAKILGIHRNTLNQKLKQTEISFSKAK